MKVSRKQISKRDACAKSERNFYKLDFKSYSRVDIAKMSTSKI